MIASVLIFSHLLLKGLGLAVNPVDNRDADSVCLSHEGGACPLYTPSGHLIFRQPGGNDELPSPPSPPRSKSPMGFTAQLVSSMIREINEPESLSQPDIKLATESSSVTIPNESILEPQNDATALAEYGSIGWDLFLDEPLNRQVLSSDAILIKKPDPLFKNSINTAMSSGALLNIDTPSGRLSPGGVRFALDEIYINDYDNPGDFPASGDGSSSPIDLATGEEDTKISKNDKNDKNAPRLICPLGAIDEITAAIAGFDEIMAGYGVHVSRMASVKKKDEDSDAKLASSKGDVSLASGNSISVTSFSPFVVDDIFKDQMIKLGTCKCGKSNCGSNLDLIEEELN